MTPLNAIGVEPGKIEELIGRLERATGPDREIDDALRIAFGYPPKPWDYTASIDAALALVERVLPGWFWRAGHVPAIHWHNGIGYDNWCHLSRTDASNCNPEDESTGWANSVPLAIILATLRAIKTLSGDRHG